MRYFEERFYYLFIQLPKLCSYMLFVAWNTMHFDITCFNVLTTRTTSTRTEQNIRWDRDQDNECFSAVSDTNEHMVCIECKFRMRRQRIVFPSSTCTICLMNLEKRVSLEFLFKKRTPIIFARKKTNRWWMTTCLSVWRELLMGRSADSGSIDWWRMDTGTMNHFLVFNFLCEDMINIKWRNVEENFVIQTLIIGWRRFLHTLWQILHENTNTHQHQIA